MILRAWIFGYEILTVQLSWRNPSAPVNYPEDHDDEPGLLDWKSSDPDDYSHLIWHPEAEVDQDTGGSGDG